MLNQRKRITHLLALATLMIVAGISYWISPSSAESARRLPPAAVDETTGASREVTVLAGGCFWGVQGVFQHVGGVISAVSGYAGGSRDTAQYETTSSGTTGHAESVQITFDPHRITYGRILQIYFSVAHDPTELNRPRCRHAVSLGNVPAKSRAESDRDGLYRAAQRGEVVSNPDRYDHRAG